ncbi:MAG: response regulator, partial [Gammaproteobacteria bacterium]|nr:response regulator [Gammaproteobacteria bacterium]
ISHTQPDIIITDLNMPQMDGFQMLNALQKNKKLDNTDVIVVTGLSQEQVKQQGSLPENTRVIYKPFEFNTLASLIRKKVNKNTGKLHSSKHLTTA